MKNNLKIALINPRVESYSSTLPPLGLLYIAAILQKHDFNVKIFDIYPYDDRDINFLISYQPDIVAMTISTDYWRRAKHISQAIKAGAPNCVFIIGGVHVSAVPEQSLSGLKADIGVIGEGEITMLELCKCFANGSNWKETKGISYYDHSVERFVYTPPRPYVENLDELPFPARHLLDFEKYLIPPGIIRGHWSERSTTAITSRGCPFQCIWCGTPCVFGRKVRYRSISNVLEEIEALISDFRIDSIWFVDDTFTLDKKRVIDFCGEIIKRGIKLNFGCQAHVKTADEEMFKIMKKAGFAQIDFGVESGSDKVLKALKKNSDAVSIRKAFAAARNAGLRTMATFMFGSPSELTDDVELTMRLAKEVNPNFVSSFFITPYPGTELMKMAEQNNWIDTGDRDNVGLKKGPMLKINFSERELFDIRSRFQRLFVFRNYSSTLFSPRYVKKIVLLLIKYPLGILFGIRKYFKTHVIDDLFFEFLIYYVKRRNQN